MNKMIDSQQAINSQVWVVVNSNDKLTSICFWEYRSLPFENKSILNGQFVSHVEIRETTGGRALLSSNQAPPSE